MNTNPFVDKDDFANNEKLIEKLREVKLKSVEF